MTIVRARPAAALGAWLTAMAVFVGPAWGQPPLWLALTRAGGVVDSPAGAEGADSGRAIVSPSGLNPLADDLAIPEPADPGLPIVTTSVADREPNDLRLLLVDGERWRLMEFGTAVTWSPLTASVKAFGQIPYAVAEPAEALADRHEPAVLSVTGRVEGFEVGAQHRSLGRRLERLVRAPTALKDREGHEIWVAQRLGVLQLRLADSELTDNVDRNPALARATKDQRAVTAELALSGWPVLGLTFASGDSKRVWLTPEGRDGEPERHEFESLTGSAHYHGGPRWDVTVSSTFSRSRPVILADDDMAMMSQDLSLTLHPLESLTVSPMLSLAHERHVSAGLGIDTGAAGLTLSYAPPASRWSAIGFVSYTATRASDASTDGRSLSLTGAVTCTLGWLPGSTVSFEAGYDRYVDAAIPESAAGAVTGFVLLKLASF